MNYAKVFRLAFVFVIGFLLFACMDEGSIEPAAIDEPAKMAESGYGGLKSKTMYRSLESVSMGKDVFAKGAGPQKLIYNAEISVRIKDYKQAEERLKSIVKSAGGYIQETRTYTNAENNLEGTITLRVPSDKFRTVLDAISKLGSVSSSREWTEDVTEEFMDVQKRIENLKALEARLLKLLDTPGAKLNDLINVETKLADVRTQIEQYEGRMRYLSNKINYSTITVTLYEPRSHQGESESVFYPLVWAVRQLGVLFFGSLGGIMLVVVGLAPWALLIFLLVKLAGRRKSAKKKISQTNQTPNT